MSSGVGGVSQSGAGSSGSSGSNSGGGGEFWLLKVPNTLHEQWEAAKKANLQAASNPLFPKAAQSLGQPIAHIWIEKNKPKSGSSRRMKLVVPPSAAVNPLSNEAPKPVEYSFTTKPKTTQLVFGASVPPSAQQLAIAAAKTAATGKPQPTPEAFRLEGEVAVSVDCLPRTDTSHFLESVGERYLASQQARPKTMRLDQTAADASGVQPLMGILPVKRRHDFASARNLVKEKRVRKDDADLEKDVLEVMSRPQYAYITIANLSKELQQPLSAISAMVKLLCVRQEDGPNKGLYTLKPEFKLAGDVAATEQLGPAAGAPQVAATTQPQQPAAYAVKSEFPVKREY